MWETHFEQSVGKRLLKAEAADGFFWLSHGGSGEPALPTPLLSLPDKQAGCPALLWQPTSSLRAPSFFLVTSGPGLSSGTGWRFSDFH